MFKRMSQLRQEGLQSLNTSSISLITYSITHFLSSPIPYFFPCFLCLLLTNCKERNLKFHPSDALLWLHFHQETRTEERKEGKRESRTKQGREEGQLRVIRVLIGWSCNGLRSMWTMRPAHCLLPQLNGWQGQTVLSPLQTEKIKDVFFLELNAFQCQKKGHRKSL